MKKTRAQEFVRNALFMTAMFSFGFMFSSCEEDEVDPPAEDPVASFQYEISEENFLEVSFENFSQNAESYSWEFGDGETSTEENPTHTYAEAGDYTVELTATNADGETHAKSEDITITDPNAALRVLAGETSKTWKLFREGVSMSLGPNAEDPYQWWSGLLNDGSRPCLYRQTFTFNIDGSYVFDDNGWFWAEYGLFNNNNDCDTHVTEQACFEAIPENMVNACGDDISAFLSGTHSFEYDASSGELTLNGEGAWIGIPKLGTSGEVMTPQESVTANVTITEETGYDLMTVVFDYGDGGYWQIVYVSYENWEDEPDVVSFMVDFDYSVEDFTVTFENLSADATSYSWDFGDGSTSTEENPTHTYAEEGAYEVVLTGTDANGDTKVATKNVTISLNPTEAAPTPTEAEADVISIYSDAYTDISGVNLDPDWGQATVTQEVDIAGEMAIKMADLNYQGIDWAENPQDVSGKTNVHVDVYCTAVTDINLSLIGGGAENPVTLTTEAGVWKSFDIDLSEYTEPDLTGIIQVKFDDAGTGASPTIFVDNIYFY